MITVKTGFDPHQHGFPFPNSFDPGKPLWVYRFPFGRIPIGDASKGMCGGMVFAALDYWHKQIPIPHDPEISGLHEFLAARLWDSFHFPIGVARIYRWMMSEHLFRLSMTEWTQIKQSLDKGVPLPLMLIKAWSRDPWNLGKNHQVLATGYREDSVSGKVSILLYEPNYPISNEAQEVTLEFVRMDTELGSIQHSQESELIRGFFINSYSFKEPLITS